MLEVVSMSTGNINEERSCKGLEGLLPRTAFAGLGPAAGRGICWCSFALLYQKPVSEEILSRVKLKHKILSRSELHQRWLVPSWNRNLFPNNTKVREM